MNGFESYFPVKLIFGVGKLKEIGDQCAKLGKRAFGVFDPFLKGGPVIVYVRELLKASGVELVEFYNIVPNPRFTQMDEGVALCLINKCDCVVTIGGGSAIDSGKAIALAAAHGGSCWYYTERYAEPDKIIRPQTKGLPVLTVPTTAGTGTEATLAAVVNNPGLKLKSAIISPLIYPDVSIIDPELMYSTPPKLTAYTGLDTFAHAFESFIANGAQAWSEMLALKSIELFARSIRVAYNEPRNATARSEMALSCTLAGAAFSQSGLCLPHAMGQPVSALFDAPHGATLAICMPPIIQWTLPAAEEKIAKVAEIFDPSLASLPVSEKAMKMGDILQKLYQDLRISETYKDYGMTTDDIEKTVELAFDHFQWDIKGHPKPVTREDMAMLYQKCL